METAALLFAAGPCAIVTGTPATFPYHVPDTSQRTQSAWHSASVALAPGTLPETSTHVPGLASVAQLNRGAHAASQSARDALAPGVMAGTTSQAPGTDGEQA